MNNEPATPPGTTPELQPTAVPAVVVAPTVATPAPSATVPPPVSPQVFTAPAVSSAPVNTEIISSGSIEKGANARRRKIILISVVSSISFLVIFVAVYFWILPAHWASAYSSKVKTAYNQQTTKMNVVYESFSRPGYNPGQTTLAGDEQDYSYTEGVIKDAQTDTTTLAAQNHLTLWPGMSLLPAAAKAKKEYQAIGSYVAQSNAYLSDYQETAVYLGKFLTVADTDLPQVLGALAAFGNARTLAAFTASSQAASPVISQFVTDLSALQPSPDLKQTNDDLIDANSQLKTGLDGMNQAISVKDLNELILNAEQVQQAGAKLQALGQTSIAQELQGDSSHLKSQIAALKSANPLN